MHHFDVNLIIHVYFFLIQKLLKILGKKQHKSFDLLKTCIFIFLAYKIFAYLQISKVDISTSYDMSDTNLLLLSTTSWYFNIGKSIKVY